MIALLMGLGLPARVAKLASWGIITLALVAALWWLRRDAYNDGHTAGVTETDAKWQAAFDKLKAQAAKSATKADAAAAARVEVFTEQAAKEQERIDQAKAEGKSPLDVLFGG